jgi:PAS domain S-box-containing protein
MSSALRVLIVEDSKSDAELIIRDLQRAGYVPIHERVQTAAELKSALEREDWAIVIADSLPQFDAFAALKILQENGRDDIPFIVVAAAIGEDTAVAMMKAGAHDYVMKDKMARLIPAVQRELDYAEVRRKYKQADQAFRQSEQNYRSLAENSTDIIIRFDKENRHLFVNPSVKRVLSLDPEDFIGKSHRGLGFPSDEYIHWERAIQQVFETGKSFDNVLQSKRENGCVTIDLRLYPEFSEDGKVRTVLGIARDVTKEKFTEAQLRHAEKMEAIGTLAGGIAHDFNNLLQAILGYGEIILLNKKEDDRDFEKLQRIIKAAKRGSELTSQLLTFSRKVESRLQPLALNHIIENIQTMMDRTIPKMIKIEYHLSPNLLNINADASQMEQMLINLAVNARDAMPRGGTLAITTENVIVNEDNPPPYPEIALGEYVQLTVSDTGQGIDIDTLQYIFDPFFTTKELGKGTGLGLSTVYGNVKNHHGHIICYSELNRGTTFKIFLPAIEPPEKPLEAVAVEKPQGGAETILLIDDEEFIRDLGERILTTFGYSVFTAPDGESALELYRKQKDAIDLIILDLIMPGIGGRECLLRLLDIDPQARIVIASGHTIDGPVRDVVSLGARDFIHKPYGLRQMLKVVREVLNKE